MRARSQIDGRPLLMRSETCQPPGNPRDVIDRLTGKQQAEVLLWLAMSDPAEFEKAVYYATTRYPGATS